MAFNYTFVHPVVLYYPLSAHVRHRRFINTLLYHVPNRNNGQTGQSCSICEGPAGHANSGSKIQDGGDGLFLFSVLTLF